MSGDKHLYTLLIAFNNVRLKAVLFVGCAPKLKEFAQVWLFKYDNHISLLWHKGTNCFWFSQICEIVTNFSRLRSLAGEAAADGGADGAGVWGVAAELVDDAFDVLVFVAEAAELGHVAAGEHGLVVEHA